MKHLLISAATIALLSGAAVAADLPAYEPAPAAVVAPMGYDWSGVYVGAQAGYGWADVAIDDGFGFTPEIEADGFFAGGLVGAQWQWNQFVLGLEGELNWSDVGGSELIGGGPDTVAADIDWFGSVSGKAGFAAGRVLFYGTGGVAFANASTGQDNGVDAESNDETFIGWTVGAGLDAAVTNNIIVGLNYKYYDFGSETIDLGPAFTDRDMDLDMHAITARIAYKF
jgi:outer membrane immunogenic protein